ncbi:MAG: serine hydrolase domain-containing protein, partial [Acidobacteriota bacterium]
MKKSSLSFALGLLLAGLLWSSEKHPGQAAFEAGLLRAVVPAADLGKPASLLERMVEEKVPGLSIAVLEDGEIAWAAGYGVVRAGEEAPVTPQTLFLAGSISKPVAATGALRLVQEGTVALDADVNDLLESWKVPASDAAAGKPVTLRGLLTHTAGLTVHGFPGYPLGAELPT